MVVTINWVRLGKKLVSLISIIVGRPFATMFIKCQLLTIPPKKEIVAARHELMKTYSRRIFCYKLNLGQIMAIHTYSKNYILYLKRL